MNPGHDAAWFLGGAFLPNAAPRGQGLSSSTVNVLWGFLNPVVVWGLLARVGCFDPGAPGPVLAAGLGALALALLLARRFGRFNGGDLARAQEETPPQ